MLCMCKSTFHSELLPLGYKEGPKTESGPNWWWRTDTGHSGQVPRCGLYQPACCTECTLSVCVYNTFHCYLCVLNSGWCHRSTKHSKKKSFFNKIWHFYSKPTTDSYVFYFKFWLICVFSVKILEIVFYRWILDIFTGGQGMLTTGWMNSISCKIFP